MSRAEAEEGRWLMDRGDDRHERPREADPEWSERRALRRYRACLIISIPAYLGLAAGVARVWPHIPIIAWVLVLFAAQSAVHLLLHFLGADGGGPDPGQG